ncbi:MAG: sigma-54-dependent Fis family transcriptional regulator [Deltaproteobacteria bacterium]|nr:sigma-54-dependent Fis family transcriptional regulator [Deltaproteobacteria bacterium]
MAKILIVDDDQLLCKVLADQIKCKGHQVESAFTLASGREKTFQGGPDVVFLDVFLPDGNGLDVLKELRQAPTEPEIIIMTGKGDSRGASLAIKYGAWDYIQKPSPLDRLMLPLVRALQYRDQKESVRKMVTLKREKIIGNSPAIMACINMVARAAESDANVLIVGETGTGKELFAEAIHRNSPRSDKPFVVVDCPVLPQELVGSLLFGHAKGSFTGADSARTGLIKYADGGSLFLDEVAELPMTIQSAFLRVLERRRFRPIGGKKEISSDFRVIAATNRNLADMVSEGTFRNDLLFRLRTLNIHLPPLRDRLGDIPMLTMYYVEKACSKYRTTIKGFSSDFFDALAAYAWPGNVRELFNALESAIADAYDSPTLYVRHLPERVRVNLAHTALGEVSFPGSGSSRQALSPENLPSWKEFKQRAETDYCRKLMSLAGGDIKEACRISRLSRARMYQLVKKHLRGYDHMPRPKISDSVFRSGK